MTSKPYSHSLHEVVREIRLLRKRLDQMTRAGQSDALLSEILNRYLELHLKPNCPASYGRSMYAVLRMTNYFGKTMSVSQIRPLMDSYKAWRKETVKASSVKRELTILKAATHKALEWQLIADDPLKGYKLEKVDDARTRYIEDAEFHRFLDVAHPDLVPILLVARHQGMRQGEILALQWTDINLERGSIFVRRSKSGEGRFLPMTSTIQDMLSRVPISERTGPVFKHRGRPIIRLGWLRHEFVKAVRKVGLIDFRFHDLRHTFASHIAMKGGDIQALAALLGHKTLQMTQRYTHLSPGYLKATIELAVPQLPKVLEGKDPLVKNDVLAANWAA